MSYGVLPHDEAERLFDIVSERKKNIRINGGMSSPVSSKKSSQMKKTKKARVMKDEGFDPDMQISSGDAIGRASL